MLVSCSYCGGRHKRGHVCQLRPKRQTRGPKEETYISAFRNSRAWQKKRAEIKALDLSLCSYCKLNGKYVFSGLSVHHIRPISRAWAARLENANLITLCSACHSAAENGNISSAILLDLAQKRHGRSEALEGPF